MTWQSVFFSSNGRIGQKDFWIAALILFGAWIVSFMLHVFAFFAWLVLAYCWICILSKRLHDAGRSGWLVLVPVGVGCVAAVIGIAVGSVTAITAIASGFSDGMNASSWAVFWGSLGVMAFLFGLAGLFKLVFILWVGLSASDASENRHGPPPIPWLKPATPPPAAA